MKYEVFWKNPGYKIRPELKEDIECDYLIVGGGVTGVSLAYFLNKFGAKNIVLIEKNYIASGATGKAAGTLVLEGEFDLQDVIKKHGKKKGTLYWKEASKGLKVIKDLIEKERIECEAEPQDTLYCGYPHKSYNDVKEEYEFQKSIDKGTRFLEGKSLKKELNTPLFNKAVLSPKHGLSVNPLKLTQNLSNFIEKKGVKVYEKTSFLRHSSNIARTQYGRISYKNLIFAIDSEHPAEEVKNIKSTIVVTRQLTKKELLQTGFINKKILNKKIAWDAKKNYDYFKITKENRLLVGFGGIIVHKRHKKTDPHFPHLKQLTNFISKLFPYLNLDVEYAWSGHFGVTDDYYPLIESKNNITSISGAATQVVCVMASKHVANKLLGKKSNLDGFFSV